MCELESVAASQQEMSEKPSTSNRGGEGAKKIKLPATNDAECPTNNVKLWSFGSENCTEVTVSSPGYPGWYPANKNCQVHVESPKNTKVILSRNSIFYYDHNYFNHMFKFSSDSCTLCGWI